jgi:hypothetical protein
MIYLANALVNSNLALNIYEQLLEKGFEVYIPNVNISHEGREININAFEQLRKRSPNNPFLIELKKEILKVLNKAIKASSHILICNERTEIFKDQTIWEVAIGWYIGHPIFSYTDILSTNRELFSAIDTISLHDDLSNLKIEKEEIKEAFNTFVEMKRGKQKLTIKEG